MVKRRTKPAQRGITRVTRDFFGKEGSRVIGALLILAIGWLASQFYFRLRRLDACSYLREIRSAADRADWSEVAQLFQKVDSCWHLDDSRSKVSAKERPCEAEVLLCAAGAELFKGNISESRTLCQKAAAIKGQYQGFVEKYGQYTTGTIQFATGNYRLARESLAAVLSNEAALPDSLHFDALYDDTRLRQRMGEVDAFSRNEGRLRATCRTDPSRKARLALLEAFGLMQQGSYSSAVGILERADVAELEPMRRAIWDSTLGMAFDRLGNPLKAEEHQGRALLWFQENGDVWHWTELCAGKALYYLDQKRPLEARGQLAKIRSAFSEGASQLFDFECQTTDLDVSVTSLEVGIGEVAETAHLESKIRRTLQDARDAGVPLYQVRCHELLLRLDNLGYRIANVEQLTTEAVQTSESAGLLNEKSRVLSLGAERCRLKGDVNGLRTLLGQIEILQEQLGNQAGLDKIRAYKRKLED